MFTFSPSKLNNNSKTSEISRGEKNILSCQGDVLTDFMFVPDKIKGFKRSYLRIFFPGDSTPLGRKTLYEKCKGLPEQVNSGLLFT